MKSDLPVLLAEDDEHDVFFMRRAFEKTGVPNPLLAVQDGRQAIEYLAGEHEYGDRDRYPLPGLILLDIKMPFCNGFEVLEWLRHHHDRVPGALPVLVLSSSGEARDRQRATELGAREYLVKPSSFNDLVSLVAELKRRWLDTASNPDLNPDH